MNDSVPRLRSAAVAATVAAAAAAAAAAARHHYYSQVLYLGYVSVLSLLQPLVPTLLFVNNMLEVRTDIIKIGTYQRPVPRTSRDLGEWEKCLWFQNYAAVLQAGLASYAAVLYSIRYR